MIIDAAKKIKKEHFIKLILWIAGISLTLIWLAMLIATSISTGQRLIISNEDVIISLKTPSSLQDYLMNTSYIVGRLDIDNNGIVQNIIFNKVLARLDWNPLCLTYDAKLIGWFICVLLAPVGYLGCIFIIAVLKNMITPEAIKKANRKALQFGYLKQNDVEYICDEVDYNTGVKQRPYKENNDYKQLNYENDINVYEPKNIVLNTPKNENKKVYNEERKAIFSK